MIARMTELGDLLELLHGARDRVSTVRMEVRSWHHVGRSHEAMARAADGGGWVGYAPIDGPQPETFESRIRLWLAPPDRVREEREDPSGTSYGVRVGGSCWRYDPTNGAVSNDGEPDVGSGMGDELSRLLDPAPMIGLLDFGAISHGRCAGRAALRVQAVPRAGDDALLFRLGAMGAAELRLEIDAERG